jgi:hypothetical protein
MKYSIIPYQSTRKNGSAVMGLGPSKSVVSKFLQPIGRRI